MTPKAETEILEITLKIDDYEEYIDTRNYFNFERVKAENALLQEDRDFLTKLKGEIDA